MKLKIIAKKLSVLNCLTNYSQSQKKNIFVYNEYCKRSDLNEDSCNEWIVHGAIYKT